MAFMIAAPNLQLPWSSSTQDNRRYWRILGFLLIPFVLLSIAIPLIDVPEPEREELEKLPPQLARVQLEEQELPPPPPPPEPEPEEEKEEEKEPEPEEPEPEPEPEIEEVVEEPPAQLIDEAREAAEAEINQFADALSDMRDAFDLSDVNADELTQNTGEAAELDRSVLTSGVTASSGGINTSNLSRNTGGVALSGKENTKVSSKLAAQTGKATKGTNTNRDKGYRSDEDIRKVMDKNKAAIFAIYNRELRKNPTLEGKVVFKMVIEPSGKVSSASIVSSDLDDPALERKLLARIRLINFGAKDTLQTTLNYAIDFFPS